MDSLTPDNFLELCVGQPIPAFVCSDAQLGKTFRTAYRTLKFITTFKTAHH